LVLYHNVLSGPKLRVSSLRPGLELPTAIRSTEIYTDCVATHTMTRQQASKTRTEAGKLNRLWYQYQSEEITTYDLLVRASELISIPAF